MPYALGIPVDDAPIPDDVVVERSEGSNEWVLRPGLTPEDLVDRYSVVCPDGVRYLQFGNTRGHISTMRRAQAAWSQVVREIDPQTYHLVGDLPGGTRQAMFGWGKYADTIVVVVEPTAKSLQVASRLLNLSKADWAPRQLILVANKLHSEADVIRIEERLQRPVTASIPRDVSVYANDRLGRSPLEGNDTQPFVQAVDTLLDQIVTTYADIDVPLSQKEVYS